MYAIIECGGKQYRVAEGDVFRVELLKAEAGDELEINQIIAVKKEDDLIVGKPYVEGAKAVCKVLEHGKGKKLVAFRYKPKKNQRVKKGHRQPFTQLQVEKILA